MFTAAQRLEQAKRAMNESYDELSIFGKLGAHVMGAAHAVVEIPVSLIKQTWTMGRSLVLSLYHTVVNTISSVPTMFRQIRGEEAATFIDPTVSDEERMAILTGKRQLDNLTGQLGWTATIWTCISAGIRTGLTVTANLTIATLHLTIGVGADLLRMPSALFAAVAYQYEAGMIKAISKLNPEKFDVVLDIIGHQDCPPAYRRAVLHTDAAGFTQYMSEYEARAKLQLATEKAAEEAKKNGLAQAAATGALPAGA